MATFPGQVTSNVVGSTYSAMTPQDYAEQERLRREREQKREAANAVVLGQRNAQQQARQNAENQARVREAFNQLYGQNLQNAYHDQMVMSEGVPGTGVASKGMSWAPGGTGQASRFSSGNMKPWSEPGSFTPAGGWYKLPQDKLNTALDNMWRMQTDPYIRTAAKLSPTGVTTAGGAIGGSAPSAHALWEAKYGTKKKSTTKQ